MENHALWVLDMADLRLLRCGGVSRLSTSSGEVLATVETAETLDDREALFEAMDAALAGAVVVRYDSDGGGEQYRVALYNPYTTDIAVGALPATVTYSDDRPLAFGGDGVGAEVSGDTLRVGRRCIPVRHPDRRRLCAVHLAHRGA